MRGLPAALLALLSALPAALAEPPQQRPIMTLGGAAHFLGASVDMNFAAGQYFGLSPGQLTVSRASNDCEVSKAGNLNCVGPNVLNITPGDGAWVWEPRTNSDPNNQMTGAVAGVIGSGGALPTGWIIISAGLSQQVVGTGTLANGMKYIDIRLSGTSSSQFAAISFTNAVPYTYGQTLSMTLYAALTASPDIANVAVFGLKFTDNLFGQFGNTTTALTGSLTRFTISGTSTTNPAAVSVSSALFFNMTGVSGQTADFTLRLALNQTELNPNLPASVASAVKAADGTGGVNGAGVYTITGGTCATQPTTNATWAAGVLTIGAVVNAGSCTVLPPSPATLAYSSGAATGWTGATATLTPVNNSAQGFGTGPILTTSGAVTRAGTSVQLPTSIATQLASQGAIMARTTSIAQGSARIIGTGVPSTPLAIDTVSKKCVTYNGTTLTSSNYTMLSGVTASCAVSTPGGSSVSIAAGNTTPATAAAPLTPLTGGLFLGSQAGSTLYLNGSVQRLAFWPAPLTSATLQAVTK